MSDTDTDRVLSYSPGILTTTIPAGTLIQYYLRGDRVIRNFTTDTDTETTIPQALAMVGGHTGVLAVTPTEVTLTNTNLEWALIESDTIKMKIYF